MERRLWNELKMKVLSVLNDNSGLISRGVSTALGISVPCAGMVLLSMHRQRLVDRTRPGLWHIFKKPPYQYSFLRIAAILKRMGKIPIRSRLFAGIRRLNEYATSFGS
jgi:hypothetical protein